MTGRLDGRVALITGGASGMGLATVARFLAEGARVVIADLNERSGEDALASLSAGDRVRFVRTDVAEEADVAAAVAAAVDGFGQLDVLFNNAGVGGAFGAVTELHVADWDYTFAVLVRGPFLGIKHGAKAMIDQGWGGSIINTASVAGMSGGGGPLAYSAAKAAVINLTRAAAIELAAYRIRVNAINPGAILTPLMHRGRPERAAANVEGLVPWPDGVGQPEHIAGAALFLASDDSAYVTGHDLVVDGGLTAAGPGLYGVGGRSVAPPGFVGANRGSTGEETLIRQRPDRPVAG